MTKVLHICSYYTGSKLYKELFSKLDEAKIDQVIFVPISNIRDKNVNISYNMKNSEYIYSKNFNSLDRLIYFTKVRKISIDAINKIDFKNISLIHAHSLFINGGVARRLKETKGIDYIVEIQNTDVNTFFKYMIHLKKSGIRILKDASKVVFYSPSYKDYVINTIVPNKLKKELLNKSIVIPSGINDFWINNVYEERKIPKSNEINIIYVGTIDANKNINTTLEACKLLIKDGYQVNYKIVGRIGNEKYRSIVSKHPFIKYIPHCQKEELIDHYRSSDVFVMPSKHETFGLVYAEAMSQGLPIIYTRGQGFDGQFKEGEVGYSVQYNSAEEIANRVKDILNNYETISKNCIEKVDKFDWDKIAKEYMDLYNSVLNGRK